MREIKFRGKRLDNGEWVYGNIQVPKPPFAKWFMWDEGSQVEVDPNTVGQYTGLKDKNNNADIFEGDIVAVSFGDIVIPLLVVFDCGGWKIREKYDETLHDLEAYTSSKDVNSVIGNIHDNPELLKTE